MRRDLRSRLLSAPDSGTREPSSRSSESAVSVAESDSTINLFCRSQSIPDLQVVPVLFQHSLQELEEQRVANLDHIFGTEPMKISSPSTDAVVALAVRVLEGRLLHRESTVLAYQYNAIQVLMIILSTREVLEHGACLDAFISIILDSSANQTDFEVCNGIEEVALLIRDKRIDENLRLKCGEFMLLLIGHVNGKGKISHGNSTQRYEASFG